MGMAEIRQIKQKEKRCNKIKQFWIRSCSQRPFLNLFLSVIAFLITLVMLEYSLPAFPGFSGKGNGGFALIMILLVMVSFLYLLWVTDEDLVQYGILDKGYSKAYVLELNDEEGIITFQMECGKKKEKEVCYDVRLRKSDCITEATLVVDEMTVYFPNEFE